MKARKILVITESFSSSLYTYTYIWINKYKYIYIVALLCVWHYTVIFLLHMCPIIHEKNWVEVTFFQWKGTMIVSQYLILFASSSIIWYNIFLGIDVKLMSCLLLMIFYVEARNIIGLYLNLSSQQESSTLYVFGNWYGPWQCW